MVANCITSASWRTRHLRIRASLLRESLEDSGQNDQRDQWALHHVRGLDLVADGLTKPLLGAAFKRFLENLGMNLPFLQVEDDEVHATQLRSLRTNQHVHSGAASALSFLLGQTLLTEGEALEIQGERDEADPLWIAAVVLMILGAIFGGKLAVQAGQCCLQRLQVWLSPSSEPTGEVQAPLLPSATLTCEDCTTPLSSLQQSGTSATSSTLRPRSGLEQSTSGAGPARDNSERKQARSKRAASSYPAPKAKSRPSGLFRCRCPADE